jgi:hypothetical protein
LQCPGCLCFLYAHTPYRHDRGLDVTRTLNQRHTTSGATWQSCSQRAREHNAEQRPQSTQRAHNSGTAHNTQHGPHKSPQHANNALPRTHSIHTTHEVHAAEHAVHTPRNTLRHTVHTPHNKRTTQSRVSFPPAQNRPPPSPTRPLRQRALKTTQKHARTQPHQLPLTLSQRRVPGEEGFVPLSCTGPLRSLPSHSSAPCTPRTRHRMLDKATPGGTHRRGHVTHAGNRWG